MAIEINENKKRETVENTTRNLFKNRQTEIQRLIRDNMADAKLSVGNANKELIDSIITWDSFVNGGPVSQYKDGTIQMPLKDGNVLTLTKDNKEQEELYGVFNQIYNTFVSETISLRSMLADYEQVKESEETKFTEVYDAFYEALDNCFVKLDVDNNAEIAEELISNIDKLKIEGDSFIIGERIVSKDGDLKDFYVPLQMANASLTVNDLVLNEINMHNPKTVFEEPKNLEGQEITDTGANKIKINGADIDNLEHDADTKDVEEVTEDLVDEYRKEREKLVKGAKKEHVKPKKLSEDLYILKEAEKLTGNWSIGRGIEHIGLNLVDMSKYRVTYYKENIKNFVKNAWISMGGKAAWRRVKKCSDKFFNGKDQVEIEMQKASKIEDENEPIINEEALKEEIKNVEQAMNSEPTEKEVEVNEANIVEETPTIDAKVEETPVKESTEITQPIISAKSLDEEKSLEDKYQALLENVCNQIEGNVKNGDNLETELSKYGLSEKDYTSYQNKKSMERYRQLKNQKYIDSFQTELENSRKQEREEMINKAQQAIQKDYDTMQEIYKDQTTFNANNIFNNYYEELSPMMNSKEEINGKTR